MAPNLKIAVYTNGDDAFVAWAPSEVIPKCQGFLLERGRRVSGAIVVEPVNNMVGFKKDHPVSGDQKSSAIWPFQRFNWTDHAVDVGNEVRYRVTAMLDDGPGKPFKKGLASVWSAWAKLSTDVGNGMACYFNRGLVISQFAARYMAKNHLTPAGLKKQLKTSVDPEFRAFLEGDLGARLRQLLDQARINGYTAHTALYELDDPRLIDSLIALKSRANVVLSNGSDKPGDASAPARAALNAGGIVTTNRMLKYQGLGHNKFLVISHGATPKAVWTGSTNWATTGLCTQVNNGLLIENTAIAKLYRAQWDRLRDASPPALTPAGFPPSLVASNDKPTTVTVGPAKVSIWFTRTSDKSDLKELRDIIAGAKTSILFLMFSPGAEGLDVLAGQRAREPGMYVRGVVSSLGSDAASNAKNVLDVNVVSSDRTFTPDHYTVIQPQGHDEVLGPWIAEVTRKEFLQIGHAIVHSKVLVVDPLSSSPVVVTGSHNFSAPASEDNDENLVIVRGHRKLAIAYATNIMSVYAHYRYRCYIREMLDEHKDPWEYLDDDPTGNWMKSRLKSKALELAHWT
jgi:phosphatidylserine/phosphatidylglycerophosphate/cardiolipin synthase-like enzyme